MDPAGLGAIIGMTIMAGVFAGLKVCDIYKKRKQKKEFQRAQGKHSLLPPESKKEEKQPILVMKRQWKMKDLKLPKSYILHNLTVRKF